MSWSSKMLALAIGGAIGANARYWLGLWIAGWAGTRFPWGTLVINITGCFALGFLATGLDRWFPTSTPGSEALTYLILVGLLGGYTTFSTFSIEAFRLLNQPEALRGLGYVALTVLGTLLAVTFGVLLARFLIPQAD